MNYEFGRKISRILHEFSNGEMIVYRHTSNERYAIIEMNEKHHISDVQEVLNLLKRTGIPKEAVSW